MKRKMALILSIIAVAVSLTGCGHDDKTSKPNSSEAETSKTESVPSPSSSNKSESSNEPESSENSDESATTLKIKDYKLSKDYKDKDVLVVNYEFYNGSDEAKGFSYVFTDNAFQNGVECDSTVVGCDEVDAQTQLNKIQPGKTYIVTVGYHITDKSDVEIKVTDFLGNKSYIDETIKLT